MKTMKRAKIEILVERNNGKDLDEQELDQVVLDVSNDMDSDTYQSTVKWLDQTGKSFKVTKTNLRLGDIDSYQDVFISSKIQADELAKLWAMDTFEFCVNHNPMWRIDQYEDEWKIYEEENPKWAYEFSVSEADITVYERAVETKVFQHIQNKRSMK